MESGPSCSYQASTNRIFLSHSGEQKGFVERLYRRLTMAYMSGCIFFDKAMPMGVNFAQKIKQAIEQCELAIVVMSEDYFKSYWPMVELAEIVKAQKSQKQKKVHIVPLFYKLTVEEYKQGRNAWRDEWKVIINAHPNHFQQPDNELECWVEALNALSPTLKGVVFGGNSEEDYIEEIVNEVCRLVAPSPPYTCVQGSERLKAELKEVRESAGLWTCHELLSLCSGFENLHVGSKLYRRFCQVCRYLLYTLHSHIPIDFFGNCVEKSYYSKGEGFKI